MTKDDLDLNYFLIIWVLFYDPVLPSVYAMEKHLLFQNLDDCPPKEPQQKYNEN